MNEPVPPQSSEPEDARFAVSGENADRGEPNAPSAGESPVPSLPGEPAATGNSWTLPLPAYRSHRRVIQLLVIGLGLLAALGIQQWYAARRKPAESERSARVAADIRAIEKQRARREAKWLKSAPADLMTDVAVHYTFESDTIERLPRTTLVKDLSGHGNWGVLNHAQWTEQGKIGGGAAIAEEEGCVSLPTIAHSWFKSGEPVAVSMWIYENRYRRVCYLFETDDIDITSEGITLWRLGSSRNFSLRMGNVGEIVHSEEVGARQWHHLIAQWTGREVELYVDGKLSTAPGTLSSGGSSAPQTVEHFGARMGRQFDGTIDEVLVFRRRLFPEEVDRLYHLGQEGKRPPPPEPRPPLAAFWDRLDLARAAMGDAFNKRLQERLSTSRQQSAREDPEADVAAYAFSLDGNTVLVGHNTGIVSRGTNQSEGTRRIVYIYPELGQPEGRRLRGLAMAPNASLAASFGESGTICLFDMSSFAVAAKINTSLQEVTSVAFSPDSKWILAGGRLPEGDVQLSAAGIWEAATGKLIRHLPVPGPEVTAVAYWPEGSCVVTATSDDRQFHVFDPVRGRLTLSFAAGPGDITCLRFVPDSRRLFSGGKDSMLRLWDIETGQQIRELSGHLAAITCLDISRDGRMAVSGSLDGTARLWNLDRGCKLEDYQIDGEGGHLRHVMFAPDNQSLWVGYSRGATVTCPLSEILDYPELPNPPPNQ